MSVQIFLGFVALLGFSCRVRGQCDPSKDFAIAYNGPSVFTIFQSNGTCHCPAGYASSGASSLGNVTAANLMVTGAATVGSGLSVAGPTVFSAGATVNGGSGLVVGSGGIRVTGVSTFIGSTNLAGGPFRMEYSQELGVLCGGSTTGCAWVENRLLDTGWESGLGDYIRLFVPGAYSGSGAANPTPRLILTRQGNLGIGIGTVQPTAQLQVAGTTAFGGLASFAAGARLTGGSLTFADNSVQTTALRAGIIGTSYIDPTQVQRRVASSCPAQQYVTGINQDGTVACSGPPLGAVYSFSQSIQYSSGAWYKITNSANLASGPYLMTLRFTSFNNGGAIYYAQVIGLIMANQWVNEYNNGVNYMPVAMTAHAWNTRTFSIRTVAYPNNQQTFAGIEVQVNGETVSTPVRFDFSFLPFSGMVSPFAY